MKTLRALLIALAALAASVPAASAAQPGTPAGGGRPKVGLVLGGGGARGGAHLGVLEVLEEMRIPFDCVAGTSMGALMSGAYVSGVTPEGMRDTIGKTDWDQLFDDSAGRDSVSLRRKLIDDRFYSGLEFGVTKDGLRYREGAVAGEKIKLFFNELVRADLGERNIEDLPLPLTLIATDIGTGERVAMRSGNLTSAMRASMSVPGAIAPVVRDGRKLVDGGLVDNVPVQEVRDRCGAEVVIAVNVGSPMLRPDEVTGVLSVVGQMVNLLTEQNVTRSLALLGPRDIYMRPELGDISAADFKRQIEAAAIGRKAALAVADRLRNLSVPPEAYQAWRSGLRLLPPPKPPVVDEVRIAELKYVNAEHMRGRIRQKDGESLDSKALANDIVLAFSEGDFQNFDYSLVKERDRHILRLTPVEKAWGPDYLRFGVNFESDFRSESPYNIRALYRKTWLNAYGGEWLTGLQIGSDQVFFTEWYQPVGVRQRFFVRPFIATEAHKVGVFSNGDRVAEYLGREDRAGVAVGANLGVHGQASAGWIARRLSTTLETGSPRFPDVKGDVSGLTANVALDTQDYAFFPTKGFKANATYFLADRVSGGFETYGRAEGRLSGAWSFGDLILLGGIAGGQATKGKLPIGDGFSLGGLGKLSAYAPNQILGQEAYGLGNVQVQYHLTQPMPILGFSLLAGVAYEAGYMKNPVTEPTLTGRIDSWGVYLAANSFLGPIYLGYSRSPQGTGRVYLFVGTP